MRLPRFTLIGIYTFCFTVSTAFAQNRIEQAKGLFDTKKYNEAMTTFKQIVKTDAKNAEAYYYLGRIYFRNGDYDKAKDQLKRATEISNDNVDYHLWLGKVYRDKARTSWILAAAKWAGKWKDALEKAFEIDPTHLDARSQLIGYLLGAPGIGGGDKERGKRLAEETIAIDEIRGHLLLAFAYRRMEKMDLSLAEYEKVLALDPQNGRAYRGLGYMFLSQEKYDQAESNLRNYIKLAPDDADAYDSLGDYFIKRQMKDEAIEVFQKAVDIDPEFSDSRFKLARTYDKKGMMEKALHHYEKIVELTPGYYKIEDIQERMEELNKEIASKKK